MALETSTGSVPQAVRQVFENPASEDRIRSFHEWEKRNAARMLSRYAELPVASVFGLRPSDVVTIDRKMTFDFSGADPRLFDDGGRYVGTLANAPAELLQRFLAALDGRRPFAAICSQPPFAEHADSLQGLVGALLGGPFLIPAALRELEEQLPAFELLRFPSQSPYAMPREYWENSVAVRQALDGFYECLDDLVEFSAGLRGLHRLATLGTSGTNYYGGVGGLPTVPGELRGAAVENRFNDRKKWIFERWLRLLEAPYALVESGWIATTNGVPLVRISDGGHECHHPYGRDGEQLASQLSEVRAELAAARGALATDRNRFLRHCALFHHAFAHAHPFGNINNSIAMSIVNDLLRRARVGALPHLYFDQVAYFLRPEDYVVVFSRGVEAHVINGVAGRDRPATKALLQAVTGAVGAGAMA